MTTAFSRTELFRVFFFVLIVMIGCVPVDGQSPSVNRVIYGLSFEPSGFDPHRNASAELGIPLRMVYDTLVYRDPGTGEFVAGLAESWEVSADGLAYTFLLRQGVTFHDGTPFNASAVAATIDRVVSSDTASQKAVFMLGSYAAYEVVDEFTIRLLMSEPYAPLLDSLSQVYLGIASPTALASVSSERYQFHQVGTGPYTFVEYVPGDRLVIRRNPNYAWGPAFYQPPAEGALEEIEFRFYPDPGTRALALEAGDVQIVGEILPTDARALALEPGVELLQVPIPGQPLQFLMNTTRYPTGFPEVRQALLFGTNREIIVDSVFQRYSPVAWGPVSAPTTYYDASLIGSFAPDAGAARALLESIGLVDADSNGYYDGQNDSDVEVRVIVPPWGLIPEVAQVLVEQWRAIGIRGVLISVPTRAALFEEIGKNEYNLVAWYEFGADPAFLSSYFLSSGSFNWTGYADAGLDGVLIQAASSTDAAARATLYAQAQQTIMAQALVLPIRDYVNINGLSTTIQGLTFDYYGWFPLLVNARLAG
jgi:peptide/nickel transport system substrate-binding protein